MGSRSMLAARWSCCVESCLFVDINIDIAALMFYRFCVRPSTLRLTNHETSESSLRYNWAEKSTKSPGEPTGWTDCLGLAQCWPGKWLRLDRLGLSVGQLAQLCRAGRTGSLLSVIAVAHHNTYPAHVQLNTGSIPSYKPLISCKRFSPSQLI